jgi:hypothetical protein
MTKKEDSTQVIASVNFFIDNVISEMKTLDMSYKKADMIAYIRAWTNKLQTIKNFTKI